MDCLAIVARSTLGMVMAFLDGLFGGRRAGVSTAGRRVAGPPPPPQVTNISN